MNEETGTVALLFLINADGKVADSKVDKSSGSKSLDKAALSAFSQCKFKPGTRDGKVEELWAKVEFVWKLE
jgi:protein TonB